ncbi:restriction endonuclease subunit S [Hydrogenophaga sp.]|uniref:restriction endonuclease subunit S n=1 Tax=Hydrogenophaga sp. TaxID=1904254 RepID=UPI00273242D1|nr:restriction endonuclease subunit S [Hydrogenophaga sp.]MDP3474428.1 restriction endonuclease subunit S [Hydrogenophaga sp.]
MSSEVLQHTLESLCLLVVDCPHATPKWTDSGVVVLRNQNIKGGRLDLSSPSFTDEAHYLGRTRRAAPRAGDIVITREAPMGDVCLIPPGLKCCLGQRQVLLRPDPSQVDSRFLLYALQSPYLQHQIGWNEGTGSTVSNLRIPVLEALRVPTPPLSVQQEIAETLGALDDRITLLRETNATLEAIAQTLFKSWFVNFDPVRAKSEGRAPEGMDEATAALFPDSFEESALGWVPRGWRAGHLADFAQLHKGTINPLNKPTTRFEHYSLPAFDKEQAPVFEAGAEIKSNKTSVPVSAVLLSKLNPHIPRVWLPADVGDHAVCSTEFMAFVPHSGASREIIYCLFSAEPFKQSLCQLVTGTSNSHQRVKPESVLQMPAVLPPKNLLHAFTQAVAPLYERVAKNRKQAQTLATLRDTLLPRLISGQLQVTEVKHAI